MAASRLTSDHRYAGTAAAAVAAASLAVYAATAARLPWWGDSAEFVTVAHTLGIAHPPGYPLYTLLGAVAVRLLPGPPFLRLSLLSAAFASLAAAVAALTVWSMTALADRAGGQRTAVSVRVAASLLDGLALAFSRTFWSQATVPEVYSLSAFLLLLVLFLTCVWLGGDRRTGPGREGGGRRLDFLRGDRPVLFIGLVLGLALAHHLTAALAIPPVLFALYCGYRKRPSARAVLASLGLLAVGLSLYAYLPLRAAHDPAVLWSTMDSPREFLRHVSGESYSHLLFDAPLAAVRRKLVSFLAGVPEEIPWLVLGLSCVGVWALWRRSRVVLGLLGAEALLVLAHAMSYRIRDIESYYIPVYGVLALAAGFGLFELAGRLGRLGRHLRAAVIPVAIAAILAGPVVQLGTGWRLRDLSDRRDAAVYLDRMLGEIEPRGIVAAVEDNIVFLLWYARFVEGRREDIAVVDFSSRAPHLAKWYPGIRFPDDRELAEALADSDSRRGANPTVENTRVAAYLPLLVSLNASLRPIYLDPAVAVKRLPSRSVPQGLLAHVMADSVGAVPDSAARESSLLWDAYLATLMGRDDLHPETARNYARALCGQGGLWLARGEPEKAMALLTKAIELAPNAAEIRNNLGAAYERVGHLDDAMAEYRRAIDLDPGAAISYRNMYVALRNLGEFERAKAFLVTASRLDPENTDDLLELGALSEQLGEPGEAELSYREAERLEPDSPEVAVAFGDYLTRVGRYQLAVAYYQRADAAGPGSARVQRGLARCWWALGDPDRALAAMRRAVALAPDDATASYDLAVMLVRGGRAGEALEHLDAALAVDSGLWHARALKAGILTDLGRYDEARRQFELARSDGAGGEAFWRAWVNLERAAGDSAAVRGLLERRARDQQTRG